MKIIFPVSEVIEIQSSWSNDRRQRLHKKKCQDRKKKANRGIRGSDLNGFNICITSPRAAFSQF